MATRSASLSSGGRHLTGKRICRLGAGCCDSDGADLDGQYIMVLGSVANFAERSAAMTDEEEATSLRVMEQTVPTQDMIEQLFKGLEADVHEKLRVHSDNICALEAKYAARDVAAANTYSALHDRYSALQTQYSAKHYEQLSENSYKRRYRTLEAEYEQLDEQRDSLRDDHADVVAMFRELEAEHAALEDTHAELAAAAPARRSKRLRALGA